MGPVAVLLFISGVTTLASAHVFSLFLVAWHKLYRAIAVFAPFSGSRIR